jgi:protein gp37
MGSPNYENGFELTIHEHVLNYPLGWKSPKMIFVNSMSDLLHESVPEAFIQRVFDVMREADWHSFQILTKRSDRLVALDPVIEWPRNVWMGVSVETKDYAYRIDDLRNSSADVKFLSLEPLLSPLGSLDLSGIDWVIVGGESGPRSRPIDREWVVDIRRQCEDSDTPFFFKQWGGVNKKKAGRILDGRTWDEMPVALQSSSELRTSIPAKAAA